MKKTGIILSVIVTAVLAGLSIFSCNSAVQEEQGIVILDFGGGVAVR